MYPCFCDDKIYNLLARSNKGWERNKNNGRKTFLKKKKWRMEGKILWNIQFWLKWWPNLYLCMPHNLLYTPWHPLFWTNCYNEKVMVGSINLLIWATNFEKWSWWMRSSFPIVRPPSLLKANQFPIWHPRNYTFIFLNITFVLVQLFLTTHFHNS